MSLTVEELRDLLLQEGSQLSSFLGRSGANVNDLQSLITEWRRKSINETMFSDSFRKEYADLDKQIKDLEVELESNNRTIASLEPSSSKDSTQQRKIDRLKDEIEDVKNSIKNSNEEIEKINAEIKRLSQENKELEGKIESEKGNVELPPSSSEEEGNYELIRWDDLSNKSLRNKTEDAEVYTASRAGEKVLVKKFASLRDFDLEINTISQLHSGYVIMFYGACRRDRITVQEYPARGDLYSLLRDSSVDLSWDKRWTMACDLSLALWYLHGRYPAINFSEKYFLRMDNCYVRSDWRVKLSLSNLGPPPNFSVEDFGKYFYAPELFKGAEFSEKTNAFSYAIVLWFLATKGETFPFWKISELEKKYNSEERPTLPSDVPEEFEKLIQGCWRAKPESRTTFRRLVKVFKDKGLLENKEARNKEAATKLEDVEREWEVQRQLLEKVEKNYEQLQKRHQRESQLTECTEQEKVSAENRLNLEKKKSSELEAKIAQLNSEMEALQKNQQNEDKKRKKEKKNLDSKNERLIEEKEEELRELEKKYDIERRRCDNLRKQLEDTEKDVEAERNRRMDAEKRRDEFLK